MFVTVCGGCDAWGVCGGHGGWGEADGDALEGEWACGRWGWRGGGWDVHVCKAGSDDAERCGAAVCVVVEGHG